MRVDDLNVGSVSNLTADLAFAVTGVRVISELGLQPDVRLVLWVNYDALDRCIFDHDCVADGEGVPGQLVDDPLLDHDRISEKFHKIVVLGYLELG